MARIFLLSFLVGNHNCLWRTQKGFRRRWGMRWGRGLWWGWIQEQTNNLLNTEVRCSNDRLIFVEGGNYTVASTTRMERVKQHRAAWLMAETTQSHPLHWFSSFLSFSSMTTREEHSWPFTLALSHYPYLLSFSPSYFHFHVATHTCVTRPARKELFMFSCGVRTKCDPMEQFLLCPKYTGDVNWLVCSIPNCFHPAIISHCEGKTMTKRGWKLFKRVFYIWATGPPDR